MGRSSCQHCPLLDRQSGCFYYPLDLHEGRHLHVELPSWRACFAGPHTRGIVTWVLESADGWLPPVMPAGTVVQPVGRGIVEFYFYVSGL
jgi:hypothetical protein